MQDNKDLLSNPDSSNKGNQGSNKNQNTNPAQNAPQSGGPNFGGGNNNEAPKGLEHYQNDGWGNKVKDFVQTHKAKLLVAVALVLAVSLVLAGSNGEDDPSLTLDDEQEEEEVEEREEEEVDATEESSLPSFDDEDGAPEEFTQAAQAGDGITHLARNTVTHYLEETDAELTDEQRVYAEDYLTKQTDGRWLEVGEEVTFHLDDVQKAFELANELEEAQLDNLKQYSQNVDF